MITPIFGFKPIPSEELEYDFKSSSQSIRSIATCLNHEVFSLLVLQNSGWASEYQQDVEAFLSLLDSEEEKLELLKDYRKRIGRSLQACKYWTKIRTSDKTALLVKLVRRWLIENNSSPSINPFGLSIDSFFNVLFNTTECLDFYFSSSGGRPINYILEEIRKSYSVVLDDYAVAYVHSCLFDWLGEQIKLINERTLHETDKNLSNTRSVPAPFHISEGPFRIEPTYNAFTDLFIKSEDIELAREALKKIRPQKPLISSYGHWAGKSSDGSKGILVGWIERLEDTGKIRRVSNRKELVCLLNKYFPGLNMGADARIFNDPVDENIRLGFASIITPM